MEKHSPQDFLVGFVGVFVVGHDARLEVLIQTPVPGVPVAVSAQEEPPAAQVVSAAVVRVALRPGHHQKAEAAAQRQAQDEGQSGPEHGQKGRETHV